VIYPKKEQIGSGVVLCPGIGQVVAAACPVPGLTLSVRPTPVSLCRHFPLLPREKTLEHGLGVFPSERVLLYPHVNGHKAHRLGGTCGRR
jgi:hypothetical protein